MKKPLLFPSSLIQIDEISQPQKLRRGHSFRKSMGVFSILLLSVVLQFDAAAQNPGGASTAARNWYRAEVGNLLTNTPANASRNLEQFGTAVVGTANAEHNFYPYLTGFSSTSYVRSRIAVPGADASTGTNFTQNTTPKATWFVVARQKGDGGNLVGVDNDHTYASEYGLKIVKDGTNSGKLNRYNFSAGADEISALDATTVKGSNAFFGLGIYDNTATNISNAADKVDFILNGQKEAKTGIATSIWTPHLTIGYDGWTGSAGTGTEEFEGDINEVLMFDSYLSAADCERISTYLALKYSITLKSVAGASTDYKLSNGTTIWSVATNAGFNNNIAGLVRDDNGLIDQRQAASSSSSMVAISNVLFANDNASNANALTNNSAMMWGSDAGSAAFATPFAFNGMNNRMNRIFKVQETGAVGTVEVAISRAAIGACSTNPHLIVSGDNSITSSDQLIPMTLKTIGGVEYYTATIDLTSGQYFTFGAFAAAPGGIASGLDFWLNPAMNVTKSGTSVTGWSDADGGGNNPSLGQATSTLRPTFSDGDALSNYNPYINFAGSDRLHQAVTGSNYSSDHTTFGVVNHYGTKGDYTHFIRFSSADNADGGTHNWGLGYNITALNKVGLHYISAPFAAVSPSSIYNRVNDNKSIVTNEPTIYSASNVASSGSTSVGHNGNEVLQTGKGLIGTFVPYNFLTVGGGTVYGMPDNKMSEILHYSRELTVQERQKVQSYLAVKYGITLDTENNNAAIVEGNYVLGDGTVIWNYATNGTYHNRVTAIGRDDVSCLNQKQSKSVYADALITLGIDNQIAATNSANTGTFDTDKSLLVIGDNDGAIGTLTALTPGGPCTEAISTVTNYTSRVWKSVETGTVESTKVSADLSSYGFNNTMPVYMQVSSDAGFTSFSNIPMTLNGGNYETNYNFTGTQYFRFAGSTAPPANACTGDKIYDWNEPSFWNWGTKTRTSTIGDTQFIVNITDPNGAIYLPTFYPVGQYWWEHLFIPRYDAAGTKVITTNIKMNKAANKVSFEIFDMDAYFGKDVVKVTGKLGGAAVNPVFSFPQYTALSATGNTVSATTGVWDISQRGRVYVNFKSPIDEIVIEYSKDGGLPFKTYQDIRISNLDITCKPFIPEVAAADNVYINKTVTTAKPKVGERITYKFTVNNLDCANKTINFTDNLPSGLTWIDSTLSTGMTFTSANTYGNTQNMSVTGMVVPPGTSYIYAAALATAPGTLNNQASFTVGSNSYLSDDPNQVGATNPTPVTIIANSPEANLTVTKTVNKATAGQNEVLKYTYVITNPNASVVKTTFQDNLPASAGGSFKYVAGTLTGQGAAIVAPASYGDSTSMVIRDLNVPANGSLTLTVDVNTGTFTLAQTGQNVANVTPDPTSGFRGITYNSSSANTLIGACVAGTTAPTLSATTATNTCPTTTVNLNSLVTSSCPAGSTLEWHNVATGLSAANKVTNPVTVSGTYYPTCFDATNACYSPAPATGVTTTVKLCFTGGGGSNPSQNVPSGGSKSGDAGTELVPSGGTGPYNYANGSSDPACVAPVSGALPLPASSNLVVNSNGSYSYTAPTTAGTYYFCIKVCDSSTPTPICTISTYTITVAAPGSVTFGGPGGASPTQTATTNQPKSGNAATELAPTGGTAPYNYSNGSSDPLCVAPAGATALPASSNLVVNSNGTYSYTAPAMAGVYYFCIKVCDSTSPTPVCSIATYKVTVTPPACVVGTAVPSLKN